LLLAAGADANTRSTNSMANTPLHAAAAGQQADLALLLLEHGAEINATQHGGFTALHSAAQNGQIELVNLLLARGADPAALADGGRTARDFAADGAHEAVLAVLDSVASS
ncbi:MAG TPA: ankyrin repeat domain-containing protein, partial [Herpetosiphonaceae bacterium]|nr:ankyrin repeat domain-containing protein [Herpetosiphonaceae bacterium]